MAVVGGRLYFHTLVGLGLRSLWVSEATRVGALRLHDFAPRGNDRPREDFFSAFEGGAFFAIDEEGYGLEPWITDGTPGGTRRLLDVRSGPAGSSPTRLLQVGGRYLFGADDGVHGLEPWVLRSANDGIRFRRGDVDLDGGADLSDAVRMLGFFFQSGPELDCCDAADTNDSGGLDIADPIYLLQWLFGSGAPPPVPGMDCGLDLTGDGLPACAAVSTGCSG
jgi:ELWxxDGT repeat protein